MLKRCFIEIPFPALPPQVLRMQWTWVGTVVVILYQPVSSIQIE